MSHTLVDDCSLALAEAVAVRVRENPEHALTQARAWIAEMLDRRSDISSQSNLLEWDAILSCGVDEALEALLAPGGEGQRLRQNTPFVRVLSPQEVWQIKRGFRRA